MFGMMAPNIDIIYSTSIGRKLFGECSGACDSSMGIPHFLVGDVLDGVLGERLASLPGFLTVITSWHAYWWSWHVRIKEYGLEPYRFEVGTHRSSLFRSDVEVHETNDSHDG